ncbi:MAG TPA: hypothetical protein VLD67_22450 [Vicinamibacterales bacterium]|nr:hypothetical protein [Vicinamibacterales bacterium]
MKKLAIGCLIVLVLGGIAAASVGYYFYRQFRSTFAQFAELGQVPEIERGVRVRGGFVPPASEELTANQVERFIRVQALVRKRLGERFAEFEARYRTISQKENPSFSDLPTILGAYREITVAWLDAKRSQVDALNEVSMSLEEYRWIRDQAYRALGVAFMDLDMSRIAGAVRSGEAPGELGEVRGGAEPGGPETNRKLIEKFRKLLEENLALASFGL